MCSNVTVAKESITNQ